MTLRLALLLSLFPLAAHAQSLRDRLITAPDIPVTEWRDMTAGKTVIYEIDGDLFGYEHYDANSDKVTFQLDDGTCIDGRWFMEGSAYCFDWQDGPLNCFHQKTLNGSVYVIGLESGAETDDIQKVARIVVLPLSCGPALLSALEPEAHL